MTARTRLAKYTSCDVADALVHLGVKNGGYIPNLTQRSPSANAPNHGAASVVGKAYTVLYAPKSDPRPAVAAAYIDAIPADGVLVLAVTEDQQLASAPYTTVNNALYGGLMSTRARYRGAAGTVVLGRVRDLAEHRDLGYPVWSLGVGATAPGPVAKVVAIGADVGVKTWGADGALGRVVIRSGDYIVADENGVVRVPVGHDAGEEAAVDVEAVLAYLPRRVAADANVAEDIKNGRPAQEAQQYWRSKI